MQLWILTEAVFAGGVGQFLDALAGMDFGTFSGTVMVAGSMTPAVAVGTVNLAKVGSGLVSGLSHWRMGNVRWAWVLPLAIPGVVGGIMAALLLAGYRTARAGC